MPLGGKSRIGDQAARLGGLWSGRISVDGGTWVEVTEYTPTDQKPARCNSSGSTSLAADRMQPDISMQSGAFGGQGSLFDAMPGIMSPHGMLADAVVAPMTVKAIVIISNSDKRDLRNCTMEGNIWGRSGKANYKFNEIETSREIDRANLLKYQVAPRYRDNGNGG